MELDNAVNARRSIRKYRSDQIPDEYLDQLVGAAKLAPSSLNLQPVRYVIVKDPETRRKIAAATPSPFVMEAPVVIVCCLDPYIFNTIPARIKELVEAGALSGSMEYSSSSGDREQDELFVKTNLYLNAGLAMEHIVLKATDLGLGSCIVGAFDKESVKKAVDLEKRYLLPAMITLGYPDQHPAARPRLPLDELLLKTI